MSGVLISADNPRSIHAIELAATAGSWEHAQTTSGVDVYQVPSQSVPGRCYVVTSDTCNCVDFTRGIASGKPRECKHVLAVRLFTELSKATNKLKRRAGLRVVA